jgi:acyl-CoA thioesterase 8
VIAQCLAAAQKTVADHFTVHSCHCYFLLAGSGTTPIIFHVERVRDGRSFATRTVQARQRGRCIFTTTISFMREDSGGEKQVRHAAPFPAENVPAPPPDDWAGEERDVDAGFSAPYQVFHCPMVNGENTASEPYERKCRQWFRATGTISAGGGHQAHLNALGYMSDSYFIGTIARIHGLWRFGFAPDKLSSLPERQRRQIQALLKSEGAAELDTAEWAARPRLGMMVSLDHSIYFHEPRSVRADEWMFTEMESPWAGDGRGVVIQRIFGKDGRLLATCVQEVRTR